MWSTAPKSTSRYSIEAFLVQTEAAIQFPTVMVEREMIEIGLMQVQKSFELVAGNRKRYCTSMKRWISIETGQSDKLRLLIGFVDSEQTQGEWTSQNGQWART